MAGSHKASATWMIASLSLWMMIASGASGCAQDSSTPDGGDSLSYSQDTPAISGQEAYSEVPVMARQPGDDFVSDWSMSTTFVDWGDRNGNWDFNLGWSEVHPWSHVFVSFSEGHMGSAYYTVHNVVPWEGGVSVRVSISWDSPIRVYGHYLVINP
jgi:hypothetical protein